MMETGPEMLNVPYKGGGAALNDLIAGFTHVMFPRLPAVIGALAPAGTPPAIVARLNGALREGLDSPKPARGCRTSARTSRPDGRRNSAGS